MTQGAPAAVPEPTPIDSRSRNSFLRLFGSSRELLVKAEADRQRLIESLDGHRQSDALWALMDCAITVFHTGDWLRATHTDHHSASLGFAQRSLWIRMSRDICHAAKHGDLTWDEAKAAKHGPVLAKLEYESGRAGRLKAPDVIWTVTLGGAKYSVVDVMHNAIVDWSTFLDQKAI